MAHAALEKPRTEPELPTKPDFRFVVRFEDVSPTAVMVVLEPEDGTASMVANSCKLWHRNVSVAVYQEEPMYIYLDKEMKFMVSGLDSSTEYAFKIAPLSDGRELGELETRWMTRELSMEHDDTPTKHKAERIENVDSGSTLEEENLNGEHACIIIQAESHRDSTNSCDDNQVFKHLKTSQDNRLKVGTLDEISNNNECGMIIFMPMDAVPPTCSNTALPDTPCKPDAGKESAKPDEQATEGQYERCVKVIRWLECEGHIDKEFRVKCLTWFSLKATMQERRVVNVFVDTLMDDPASLAGQLIDAFLDKICIKKTALTQNGFCPRLWH